MSDREMRQERGSSLGSVFLGALIGALAGASVSLLMAPRSGDETQEEIRRRSRELRDEAEKRLNEGRGAAQKSVRQARTTVADWLEQGSNLLGEQANHLRENELEERIPAA